MVVRRTIDSIVFYLSSFPSLHVDTGNSKHVRKKEKCPLHIIINQSVFTYPLHWQSQRKTLLRSSTLFYILEKGKALSYKSNQTLNIQIHILQGGHKKNQNKMCISFDTDCSERILDAQKTYKFFLKVANLLSIIQTLINPDLYVKTTFNLARALSRQLAGGWKVLSLACSVYSHHAYSRQ